ncbi:MAG: hypothetical protein K0S00_4691 [Xanthobacteraceae bacterium]|jgi:hypothetical protein|nr:hypothetical protein [Xanthobacteraceae bacterium]
MKVRVVFLRDASPYAAGEAAGFDETEANRLKTAGIVAISDETPLAAGGEGDGHDPSSDGSEGDAGGADTAGNGDDQSAGQPGTTALTVEIPTNWQTLHHATKKKLAREISGAEPADTGSAEAVIEAELARRAAEQTGE